MLTNFRVLSALTSLGALLIIAGFFLTMLPVSIQIIFLLAGVITCIITMYGLFKYYKDNTQSK